MTFEELRAMAKAHPWKTSTVVLAVLLLITWWSLL